MEEKENMKMAIETDRNLLKLAKILYSFYFENGIRTDLEVSSGIGLGWLAWLR